MTPGITTTQPKTTSFRSSTPPPEPSPRYCRQASLTPDPGEQVTRQLGSLTLSSMKLIEPLKKLASENSAIKNLVLVLGGSSSKEEDDILQSPSEEERVFQDLGTLIDLRYIEKELDELNNFEGYLVGIDLSNKPAPYQIANNTFNKTAQKENDPLGLKDEIIRLQSWMINRLEAFSKNLKRLPPPPHSTAWDLYGSRVATRILEAKQDSWDEPKPERSDEVPPGSTELTDDELLQHPSKFDQPKRLQEVARRLDDFFLESDFPKKFLANQYVIKAFLLDAPAAWTSFYFEQLINPNIARKHCKALRKWMDLEIKDKPKLILKIVQGILIACERNPSCLNLPSTFFSEFAAFDFSEIIPKLTASQMYRMIAPAYLPHFQSHSRTRAWASLNHRFRVLELNAFFRHLPHEDSHQTFTLLEQFGRRDTKNFSNLYQCFEDGEDLTSFVAQSCKAIASSLSIQFERRQICIMKWLEEFMYGTLHSDVLAKFGVELLNYLRGDAFSVAWSAFDDLECDAIIDGWSKAPLCVPSLSVLLEASVDKRVPWSHRLRLGYFLFRSGHNFDLAHWEKYFHGVQHSTLEGFLRRLFVISESYWEITLSSQRAEPAQGLLLELEHYGRFRRDVLPRIGSEDMIRQTTQILKNLPIAKYNTSSVMNRLRQIIETASDSEGPSESESESPQPNLKSSLDSIYD